MNNYYRIGEISKLIGITTEGIRYYEKRGLINPVRKDDSLTRYYDVWDIYILMRAKGYQRLGINLDTVVDLLMAKDDKEAIQVFCQQKKLTQQKIKYYEHLLNQLSCMETLYEELPKRLNQITIEFSPEILRMNMQQGYIILEEDDRKQIASEWIRQSPFTFPSACFSMEALEKKSDEFMFGVGVLKENDEFLNLDKKYAQKFESKLCISTLYQSKSKVPLGYAAIQPLIEYAKEHNFEISGDAISLVMGYHHTKEQTRANFHRIWLPIR